MALSWPASSLGLHSYYRRHRGSAWVFFLTVLALFSPVLRFKISLGSRRGVIGVNVDSGHGMRWLPHRKGVLLCGVYCPFVELG